MTHLMWQISITHIDSSKYQYLTSQIYTNDIKVKTYLSFLSIHFNANFKLKKFKWSS